VRELTTSEAAALLGVAPQTIRNLAEADALPCRRTDGGHRRFLEGDVLACRGRGALADPAHAGTRVAVWAAAATEILRAAEADVGSSTEAGATFRQTANFLTRSLGDAARDAAPSRPRRP
jgi:excisionase family DNA binding protein